MIRLWILGAPDPEMAAIETLLREECGEYVVYATLAHEPTRRVRPAEAYRDDLTVAPSESGPAWPGADPITVTIYTVECALPPGMGEARHVIVDHHRPGDPGYGMPPASFWDASSIGQVIEQLSCCGGHHERGNDGCCQWRVDAIARHQLVAAADHCLAAAYRGECPGVDPDTLMRWRVSSRAAFQGRDEAALLADVEATRRALREAPTIALETVADMPHTYDHDWSRSVCDGCMRDPICVADMRTCPVCDGRGGALDIDAGYDTCHQGPRGPYPELPEAAAREAIGYVSGPLVGPDGRKKYTCSGSEEQVNAWIKTWAPAQGLVEVYGDPERGFAGGYRPR